MITVSFHVPSSIERTIIDIITDSILCLGEDALRIQVVDSKYTGRVDSTSDAIQLLTLSGTAYDIERLADFVETELVCHVSVCKSESQNERQDKSHAVFLVSRILKNDDEEEEYSVADWRNYNRRKRYRCYQKIQKENEIRSTDYRVRKLWEKKLLSDTHYYDYCQDFPENAKTYLYKYYSNSDEHFIKQFIEVYRIVKGETESDEEEEEEVGQNYY
jgi:hypothetical protein